MKRAKRRRWGSITAYSDGGGGGYRVRAGNEERSPLGVFTVEQFGDKDKAYTAASEALNEAHGRWRKQQAPRGRGMTLLTYAPKLFERWEREKSRKRIDRDIKRFEKHIATAPFAHDPLGAIEHRSIQRWVRELGAGVAEGPRGDGKRKRSRRTVANALNLLRTILRFAIEDEHIDESPAAGVVIPRGATTEEDFLLLEIEEADHIFGLKPNRDGHVGLITFRQLAIVVVLIVTGMRPGELWGLRWGDVPRKTGGLLTIRFNRDDSTKSGRVRQIPLLRPAVDALERWRSMETKRIKREPRPDELVFPNPDNAPYGEGYDADWVSRAQRTRAGLRYTQLGVRWHLGVRRSLPLKDLRHTCACALLRGWWVGRKWVERPLSLLEVSHWLGHASITTTEKHYAKLAPGGLRDVVSTKGKR